SEFEGLFWPRVLGICLCQLLRLNPCQVAGRRIQLMGVLGWWWGWRGDVLWSGTRRGYGFREIGTHRKILHELLLLVLLLLLLPLLLLH
ncbi:MAG: hypothetical protein QGG40_22890, partial [Myxococcota bacterium]|nr:hypothetical protein [Myxococcota bacterium]